MVRSRSFIATPPGATIKEQLNDRGMSQKEFSARMDMSEKHISRLINGDVQLTSEVAVRLEMVLGVPAKFWNNLEAIYREKLIKVEEWNRKQELKEMSTMSKFGWVPETRLMKERVINLRKYFEVVELSLLENRQITKIACRRLAITEKGDFALIAWAQEAKRVARQTDTTHINIDKLVRVLPEIRSMTLETPAEFSAELKDKLAQCGIALVFLPHLQGSFLQGASFIDGKKIVIGLTARGKDADRFWFSLFHELGHIVLGHIGKTDEITEQDENEADLWAKDELIPKEEFEQFKKTQDYSSISVCDFANKIGIAPGIVVGRLQKERCITYNMLNELKEQYEIAM